MPSTARIMQGIQKTLGTLAVIWRKTVWHTRNRTAFAINPGHQFFRGKQPQTTITAIHSENAVRKRGMSCTTTLPSTQASFCTHVVPIYSARAAMKSFFLARLIRSFVFPTRQKFPSTPSMCMRLTR